MWNVVFAIMTLALFGLVLLYLTAMFPPGERRSKKCEFEKETEEKITLLTIDFKKCQASLESYAHNYATKDEMEWLASDVKELKKQAEETKKFINQSSLLTAFVPRNKREATKTSGN